MFGFIVISCGSDDDLLLSPDGATGSTSEAPTLPTATTSGTIAVVPSTGADSASSSADDTPTTADQATTTNPTISATTGTAVTDTVTTASEEVTTASSPTTTSSEAEEAGSAQEVRIRFESTVEDVALDDFVTQALTILNDPRGWSQAGFSFVADPDGPYRVILAEGPEVDGLCLPLRTFGTVSCQNGPVVALNANRWRFAVDHWTLGVDVYRGYLVNHEVGHLIGLRHPKPRCPVAGRPAGVMEQQTAGLEGCMGNPWPRDWELEYAARRPVVYAPLPDWGPDPVPANGES